MTNRSLLPTKTRRSLREYLVREGLSQAQFANRVRLTQSSVSRMIAGDLAPSLSTAVRISRLTGIPVDEFVHGGGR